MLDPHKKIKDAALDGIVGGSLVGLLSYAIARARKASRRKQFLSYALGALGGGALSAAGNYLMNRNRDYEAAHRDNAD